MRCDVVVAFKTKAKRKLLLQIINGFLSVSGFEMNQEERNNTLRTREAYMLHLK